MQLTAFRDKSQTKKTTTNLGEEHDDELGEEDCDDRWNTGYEPTLHRPVQIRVCRNYLTSVKTGMSE
jgi:hypothetical protein